MRKIGILTFHRSINYGAFMQSYALSHEIMKRFGPIVEIVDFEIEYKNAHYKEPLYHLIGGKEYYVKYKRFKSDLNLLPLSHETIISNDFDKLRDYLSKNYEIVIVGSDAVWAFQKMELENPYWLFGDKLDCKKMSYAASAHSTDFKKVKDPEKNYIAKCLKSFQYIGVRDEETYNFIKSTDNSLNVQRNCDPTILLGKSDNNIAKYILKKNNLDLGKPIIGIMTAAIRYMPGIIKYLGKEYQFINLYKRNRLMDKYYPFNRSRYINNLSPFEWSHLYASFYMNFTNYFHGTLLGLINNIPTLAFDTTNFPYEYKGKIKQVMEDLDLNDYYFEYHKMNKNDEMRLLSQIDFTLRNHKEIREKISFNLIKEKERAESFFKSLSEIL